MALFSGWKWNVCWLLTWLWDIWSFSNFRSQVSKQLIPLPEVSAQATTHPQPEIPKPSPTSNNPTTISGSTSTSNLSHQVSAQSLPSFPAPAPRLVASSSSSLATSASATPANLPSWTPANTVTSVPPNTVERIDADKKFRLKSDFLTALRTMAGVDQRQLVYAYKEVGHHIDVVYDNTNHHLFSRGYGVSRERT